MNLEKLNEILKNLPSENYLETKISKQDVLSYDKMEDIPLSHHLARKNLLSRAFEVLEKNGESFDKKDLTKTSLGQSSILTYATAYNQLSVVQDVLKKSGEKLDKNELLGAGYENSVSALSANNGKLKEVFDMIAENGQKLEKGDVMDRFGYPNSFFRNMLTRKGWEPLAEEMRKEGFPINRDMAMDYGTGKDRPLDSAIACGMLETLYKELDKNGETFNREDFTKMRGNKGQEANMIVKVVVAGEMPTLNEILKKNGEEKFTLEDVRLDDPTLFIDGNIGKVLGVKGFSDSPKLIKEFWEKLPEEKKSKRTEESYKKALRDCMSKKLNPNIVSNRGR